MNTKLKNQEQNKAVGASAASSNSDSFDFDLWASEVRRQMVASLQKRDSEGKQKGIERRQN